MEWIGAAMAFLFDFLVAGDLSHVAAPFVALATEIAERRILCSADACHVGNTLREHADERAAGGVALPIDRKFLFGKMAPASFDHSFFKSRRPGGHAIPEIAIRLGTRKGASAVAIALRRIFDDIVLVRCDQLALLPDGRAHRAVGMDRIVGPIPARIGKIKPARKSSGHDSKTKFAGEQLGMALDAFEIARAAVKQEEAGLFAVGPDRNLA